MKHRHTKHTGRWKVAGLAAVSLMIGFVLIFLSKKVTSPGDVAGPAGKIAASAPAGTAPATSAPATAPADSKNRAPTPEERNKAARENMSSMLLLLGLLGIAIGLVCAGWVVHDVYRSRPAWKTQTKYPRRR